MADVFTDLRADTEALAELAGRHPFGPGVIPHFARLTSMARLVRLSVENPSKEVKAAPGVTRDPSLGGLGEALLGWLNEQRKANAVLAAALPDAALPWDGGLLKPSTLAAAVLTGLFAGAQDIADSSGVTLARDDGIGHVAYYCVRTRDRAYRRHGMTPPAEPFRFELEAPSGTRWAFGPEGHPERITGRAEAFCLVATGRRRLGQLGHRGQRPAGILEVGGDLAAQWLDLVQR